MNILTHKKFEKAYAKLTTTQQSAVKIAITQFVNDRSAPNLRDHALRGKLTGLRSFSAAWDLRVIYREENGFITIILLDVGTHNQEY
jgi:addiction module RelE/StbE family toxin